MNNSEHIPIVILYVYKTIKNKHGFISEGFRALQNKHIYILLSSSCTTSFNYKLLHILFVFILKIKLKK